MSLTPEIEGSANWSISLGKSLTIKRIVLLPWLNHATAIASIIGTADPSFPLCIFRQADVEPLGPITGTPASYEFVRVTFTAVAEPGSANFPGGTPPAGIPSGATVKVSIRGGGEFMLIPARDMRWEDNVAGSGAQPIPAPDSGVGKLVVNNQQWSVTLGNLIAPPLSVLQSKVGKVNSGAWLIYAAGAVLFESWDADYEWSMSGGAPTIKWNTTWHLKVREIRQGANVYGWNHEFREDGWQRVFLDGQPRYESTDFNTLFS
jgi:hypothetical protein